MSVDVITKKKKQKSMLNNYWDGHKFDQLLPPPPPRLPSVTSLTLFHKISKFKDTLLVKEKRGSTPYSLRLRLHN